MSDYFDEVCAVYDETNPRARVAHLCDACGEQVQVGHRYWRVAILFDGRWDTIRRCLRCQTIHVHLRTLGDRDQWPDERLNCGEEYADHWGEAPPPHIASLAFETQESMQGVGS